MRVKPPRPVPRPPYARGMANTEKSAPDDRHDDVVQEQQIVDPPQAPQEQMESGTDGAGSGGD